MIDRLAGTLAPGNALVAAVGIESLSGLSGFEKPGFTWRHRPDGVWASRVPEPEPWGRGRRAATSLPGT